MRKQILILSLVLTTFSMMFYSCEQIPLLPLEEDNQETLVLPPPPETWQEHWFEHEQLVKRVYYNDRIAVYFDDDVDTTSTSWMYPLIDSAWAYTRSVYGDFGTHDTTNRLFAVFHTGKYGGGHPMMYYRDLHDYRNGIDIGSMASDSWKNQTDWEVGVILHEISHIVEFASKQVAESPAFTIWGDSKWAEIYNYDLYKALNRTEAMDKTYIEYSQGTDNFPREGTAWFRNWFYPIYDQHDGALVLNSFFEKLAAAFPKKPHPIIGQEYQRRMNLGEFVHFWSAASGVNLFTRARLAFGDLDRDGNNWIDQFEAAQDQFSTLTYMPTDPFFGQDHSSNMTISVSNENAGGANAAEGSAKLNDFDIHTKFFSNAHHADFWIQQTSTSPILVNSYLLTSGNDAPNRDPKSWVLEGSNDGINWTTIDTRTNEEFIYRREIKVFDFNNTTSYTQYRLKISENVNGDHIQLSEWRLMQK